MNGVMDGVRGVPWVVKVRNQDGDGYLLLSFGHLAESVYRAYAKDPKNSNVVRTLAKGLPNSVVFHPDLPEDNCDNCLLMAAC